MNLSLCGYEPFYADSETEMFRKILKCDYQFESPWWDEVSENAKVTTNRNTQTFVKTLDISDIIHLMDIVLLWY